MAKVSKILRIGAAAKLLGVTPQTLRRWDESGRLRALRNAGGNRYYRREDVDLFSADLFPLAEVWASSPVAPRIVSEFYADTQDRFRARLDRMAELMSRDSKVASQAPLVTAVAGEIGNNSFDHNLGNWPDVPGIFFGYDINKRVIVLADRGVGIRSTLVRVRPELRDDATALRVAMTELISARTPEQRGNGLKFVNNVASSNPIGVYLQSGIAEVTINKDNPKDLRIALADQNTPGVLARIEF